MTAIVILPLVTLEEQVEQEMTKLGLRYVNLTSTPLESLADKINETVPQVILGNVESLTSPEIQRKISRLKISYIAVDEVQVADPEGGWNFRPYSPLLWRWLRATYQHVPFLLSSATLSTESLARIKVSLGIAEEEVFVLAKNCDRPNIFQQSRRLHRKVDVW